MHRAVDLDFIIYLSFHIQKYSIIEVALQDFSALSFYVIFTSSERLIHHYLLVYDFWRIGQSSLSSEHVRPVKPTVSTVLGSMVRTIGSMFHRLSRNDAENRSDCATASNTTLKWSNANGGACCPE